MARVQAGSQPPSGPHGLPSKGQQPGLCSLLLSLHDPPVSEAVGCQGVGYPLESQVPRGCGAGGKESQWLVCSVAEAAAESSLEGGNMALAIFIPVLLISLLLGGAYIYITR